MHARREYPHPIRLIAIDIDGTLLDSNWQVSERNRRAVLDAHQQGSDVVFVTGRRFTFALTVIGGFPETMTVIANNGAIIKSLAGPDSIGAGVAHYRNLLPVALAKQILALTRGDRSHTMVMFDRSRDEVVVEQLDTTAEHLRRYLARNRDYILDVENLEEYLREDPIQVMLSGEVGEMNRIESELGRVPIAGSYTLAKTEYLSRNFTILDVLNRGCSKAAALAYWAERRSIPREEIMAIGDNLNDYEMLAFAGLPVVMENSVEALKRYGWPVTASNDSSGVAAAIEEYVL